MEDIMNFPLGIVGLPVVTIHGWDSSSLQVDKNKQLWSFVRRGRGKPSKLKLKKRWKMPRFLGESCMKNTFFRMAKRMDCFSLDGRKVHQIKTNPLGGGNSNIFYFHPENWGRFPFWLVLFKWGWFNHQPSPFFLKETSPKTEGFFVR